MLETQLDLRNNPCVFEPQTEVLKEGSIFVISLPDGSIIDQDNGSLGLYYNDTRYLNCLELRAGGRRPVFLSSSVRDSHFAQIELTNPVFALPDGKVVSAQTIHLRLLRLIKGALYQRLRLINFNPFPVNINLHFSIGADFRDVFEVRGSQRQRRGELLKTGVHPQGLILAYQGLDEVIRTTHITFEPAPAGIVARPGQAEVTYDLILPPQKKIYLHLKIEPDGQNLSPATHISDLFSVATIELASSYHLWQKQSTQIWTDNNFINDMFRTAITDLKALEIDYPGEGKIIAAGIPWYTAPFGRDSLITSWQALILNPDLARHTLRFLARYQGKQVDKWREERPGKILHELRRGEMTRCQEVPHSPYYGSIDATLWFIILLAAAYRWTLDQDLLQEMATPLRRCLHWCLRYGDLDGDGYLEYWRESPAGLTNQGWKDSWDAVVDREGRIPEGPVALVEVQAYYYLALLEAAHLLTVLGDKMTAAELKSRASRLKMRFNRDFWLEEEGYLIFALDGKKRPLTTLVSNGGHALFTGILEPERARRVARRLLAGDFYSGWGIRTMSKKEKAYNPMSYHNGSVWPHDNAIIAAGLRRYQCLEELSRLAGGLFAASSYFNYRRWPELFCGFTRRGLSGPVRYPVACDPQAWAVGSLFAFLQHLLGIELRDSTLYISRPILIPGTRRVEIKNLAVAGSRLDLAFEEKEGRIFAHVLKKEGAIKVIIEA
ncbi:Six-hairpin glycosidase [Moorella glycerini]|uniref:Amylo-alpha-1,6-glucosidase n=1 Tax=Neomoorella stamsii TaxID=1266720 RepID=A0A9X7J2J4_9FIRM|nr:MULTISPECIES: glycogen debranching N-terminal domain-containing protein [Moorella]PRR72717.1 Amylo-alpha-1,6-glucosidase [Moorella stamsii]CEP68062.1 Six-hairpin glycosidase [Moorella glycerini]